MEYEIEDRPQQGEGCEYEYLATHAEWRLGIAPPRHAPVHDYDRALLIPEQELGS